MPLYAEQFFTEHLALPFNSAAVIGDSYYAAPSSSSPLRLCVDFAPTIRRGEYDGLRLRLIHPDQGVIDTVVLSFATHGTFTVRDARRQIAPGADGFARIRDWHDNGVPPWTGAGVAGLRRAVQQYAQCWFPDTAAPSGSPNSLGTAPPVPDQPLRGTSTPRTR
ncbi:hypothetical protein [Streptomyces sp. NPDC088141]|uniref:hypothetical protein n=1 Tax=Streptomyces sp. NPDC088141 TaxID=3155179 RepID=UPI003448180B